ncbi:MAG: hypothetical protein FWE22_06760 [Firmicutes bacterium]|nr:hypothetical protein [Bacillota bacterium]
MVAAATQKANTFRLIRAIIGWILFIPIVLFVVFFIISHLFFPSFAFGFFGFRTMLISNTGSMEPNFRYNDMVVVRNIPVSELEVGDIISFYQSFNSNNQIVRLPVTHQIIGIEHGPNGERAFRTSGTAEGIAPDRILVTEDGLRGSNVYIGRIDFQSRFLGNIIAYLTSTSGILSIIINLTCLLIIFYIFRKNPEKEKMEERKMCAIENLRDRLDTEFNSILWENHNF